MKNLEGKRVKFTEDVSKRLQFEEIDLLGAEGEITEFNDDIVQFLPDSGKMRRKAAKNSLGDKSFIWVFRNASSRGYDSLTEMISDWTEELD